MENIDGMTREKAAASSSKLASSLSLSLSDHLPPESRTFDPAAVSEDRRSGPTQKAQREALGRRRGARESSPARESRG